VSCSRISLASALPLPGQVLQDLKGRLRAVELVAVDPRLQPEDVGAVSHGRVEKLSPLAREAGARHLDLALTRGLDRSQDADDLRVARQAAELNLLLILEARSARDVTRRIRGRGTAQADDGDQPDDDHRREPPLHVHALPLPHHWTNLPREHRPDPWSRASYSA
jgi:hypothetical protein